MKSESKKERFPTKICKICGENKRIDEFYIVNQTIMDRCKTCHRKYVHDWNQDLKKKTKKTQKRLKCLT